jgi:hypothetical protein
MFNLDDVLSGSGGSFVTRHSPEETQLLTLEKQKADVANDPGKIDALVSNVAARLSPVTAKPKYNKFATKTEAHEANIPEDHPFKGQVENIRNQFEQSLADPRNVGKSAKRILSETASNVLATPDVEGKTALEKAQMYKAAKDSELTNYFGLFGENKKYAALPGQADFEAALKEKKVESEGTSTGEAMAWGAGIKSLGLGYKVAKALRAGTAVGAAVGGPAGAAAGLAGAAIMAIPEFFVFDKAKELVDNSMYGKTHEGTWGKLGIELALGVGAIGGGHKIVNSVGGKLVKEALSKGLIEETALPTLKKVPFLGGGVEAFEKNLAKTQAKAAEAAAKAAEADAAGRQTLLDALEGDNYTRRVATAMDYARPVIPTGLAPISVTPEGVALTKETDILRYGVLQDAVKSPGAPIGLHEAAIADLEKIYGSKPFMGLSELSEPQFEKVMDRVGKGVPQTVAMNMEAADIAALTSRMEAGAKEELKPALDIAKTIARASGTADDFVKELTAAEVFGGTGTLDANELKRVLNANGVKGPKDLFNKAKRLVAEEAAAEQEKAVAAAAVTPSKNDFAKKLGMGLVAGGAGLGAFAINPATGEVDTAEAITPAQFYRQAAKAMELRTKSTALAELRSGIQAAPNTMFDKVVAVKPFREFVAKVWKDLGGTPETKELASNMYGRTSAVHVPEESWVATGEGKIYLKPGTAIVEGSSGRSTPGKVALHEASHNVTRINTDYLNQIRSSLPVEEVQALESATGAAMPNGREMFAEAMARKLSGDSLYERFPDRMKAVVKLQLDRLADPTLKITNGLVAKTIAKKEFSNTPEVMDAAVKKMDEIAAPKKQLFSPLSKYTPEEANRIVAAARERIPSNSRWVHIPDISEPISGTELRQSLLKSLGNESGVMTWEQEKAVMEAAGFKTDRVVGVHGTAGSHDIPTVAGSSTSNLYGPGVYMTQGNLTKTGHVIEDKQGLIEALKKVRAESSNDGMSVTARTSSQARWLRNKLESGEMAMQDSQYLDDFLEEDHALYNIVRPFVKDTHTENITGGYAGELRDKYGRIQFHPKISEALADENRNLYKSLIGKKALEDIIDPVSGDVLMGSYIDDYGIATSRALTKGTELTKYDVQSIINSGLERFDRFVENTVIPKRISELEDLGYRQSSDKLLPGDIKKLQALGADSGPNVRPLIMEPKNVFDIDKTVVPATGANLGKIGGDSPFAGFDLKINHLGQPYVEMFGRQTALKPEMLPAEMRQKYEAARMLDDPAMAAIRDLRAKQMAELWEKDHQPDTHGFSWGTKQYPDKESLIRHDWNLFVSDNLRTNRDVYSYLASELGGKDKANKFLAEHGYDTITHTGGVSRNENHRVFIALKDDVVKPYFTAVSEDASNWAIRLAQVAAVAVPVGAALAAAGFIAPSNADAGTIDTLTKKAFTAKPIADAIAKKEISWVQALKNGWIGMPLPEGAKEVAVPMKMIPTTAPQVPLPTDRSMTARQLGTALKETVLKRKEGLPLGVERFTTLAFQSKLFINQLLSPEGGVVGAIAAELGQGQQAVYHNTGLFMGAMGNIIKDHPEAARTIKEAQKAVRAFAERVQPQMEEQGMLASVLDSREKLLTNSVSKLNKLLESTPTKKRGEQWFADTQTKLSEAQAELESVGAAKQKLGFDEKAFNAAYDREVMPLAQQFPTVRWSLALDDTASFEKRPWLKDLITQDDQIAIAHARGMYDQYAARATEAGLKPMSGPYNKYSRLGGAPDVEAFSKKLGAMGVSITPEEVHRGLNMTKFHHRGAYAQNYIPEYATNFSQYVPDTEKRIMGASFWGKGKENSWWAFKNNPMIKGYEDVQGFFDRISEAFAGYPQTNWNKAAQLYSTAETFRLLGGLPSAPFKHLFKQLGVLSQYGTDAFKQLPKATGIAVKNAAAQLLEEVPGLRNLGLKVGRSSEDLVLANFTQMHNFISVFDDLGIDYATRSKFMDNLNKVTQASTSMITGIEMVDRSNSFLAAKMMAEKMGLTEQQALVHIWDTIITNNFMGGVLNPSWMKNPTVRAAVLFQNTPFKIMERRVAMAMEMGRGLQTSRGLIKGQKLADIAKDLVGIRSLLSTADKEFKGSAIRDALMAPQNLVGQSVAKTFMREALLVGSVLYGGQQLGVNLQPHTFHIPFLQVGKEDPVLAASPIVQATYKTIEGAPPPLRAGEEKEDLGTVSTFFRHWFGKGGPIPLAVQKAMKISEDDIPETYKGGSLKYLFAVPGVKE